MLISWSRDAFGNTTWRIWGIKITLMRIIAVVIFVIAASAFTAITKPKTATFVDAGCTAAYPIARGNRCYRS